MRSPSSVTKCDQPEAALYEQRLGSITQERGIGTIIVGRRGGVSVLTLLGDHDMATANELFTTIHKSACRSRGVVVALDETTFIDSHVVRTLFLAEGELIRQGAGLVIQASPESVVGRVLEISGIREHVRCADTLNEAVALARSTDLDPRPD